MSSHPDTLVAYAKWFGKVAEPIQSAEMSGISTKVFTVCLFVGLLTKTGIEYGINVYPQKWIQEDCSGFF